MEKKMEQILIIEIVVGVIILTLIYLRISRTAKIKNKHEEQIVKIKNELSTLSNEQSENKKVSQILKDV
jgi:hypothetical protein